MNHSPTSPSYIMNIYFLLFHLQSRKNKMGSETNKRQEEEAFMAATQIPYSVLFSSVVKAAFELGVFDILAMEGPNAQLTAFEIAKRMPKCNQEKTAAMLDNILAYIATHSVLTCATSLYDEEGRSLKKYGLNPTSKLLAESHGGLSLAPLLRMAYQKDFLNAWYQLTEAVQEGVNPFEKVNGLTAFEYMAKNPICSEMFNKGMASNSNMVMEKFVEEYDELKKLTELIDVGGGVGTSLKKIVSKYPLIKGINFDQPHVISEAPSILGVQHIGGDMFTMIPSGGAILLKWILHDWTDEKCIIILKNCWKALPVSGKVIIVEQILPEFPEENSMAKNIYAMNVIVTMLFDGKVRTEKEFQSLAQKAGFSEFKMCCKFLNFYVMELVK